MRLTNDFRCMKDGSIVETGSHEDLIALNGEYAKLYNIQAGAFSEEKKDKEPEIMAGSSNIINMDDW